MSQLSYHAQTATGADIDFTIDTFSSDELKVYVDGVLKTAGVHYNINPYNSNSQSTVDWIGTAPSSPSIVRIIRETDVLNQGNTAVKGRAEFQPRDYYHNIIIGKLFDKARKKAWTRVMNEQEALLISQEREEKKIQRNLKKEQTSNILNIYK